MSFLNLLNLFLVARAEIFTTISLALSYLLEAAKKHVKGGLPILNTYSNIDKNDLAAMEPARKAITHHAWHVMTFFFIHWHQSNTSQVLSTIAIYSDILN